MKIEATLADIRGDDYDWNEVFKYAQGDSVKRFDRAYASTGRYLQGAEFKQEEVAEVLGSSNGENDGDNWIALLRLVDGRFAFISAGCDYTGWG